MKKFPFLEIGIVIATAILLYILIYPGYIKNKEANNNYNMISNIYALRAAYEKYVSLDNMGELPDKIDSKIYQYLKEFGVKNPYTNEDYKEGDIKIYNLENTLDIVDNTLSGKHGLQRGKPGTFAIGFFIPDLTSYNELANKPNKTKEDLKKLESIKPEVKKYTIIGFKQDSLPVTTKDMTGEKLEVFFIQGEKTSTD
uniref:Uncharacterized protein n=1 Tax=candidate division WOR-3 bacterium TaxID=2052148 RepID=A0A7C3J5C3_UNCW3